MQKKRRLLCVFCFLLIALSASLLTGCQKEGGTLTVGVRTGITDWSFCDPENDIYAGLEEQIAERIQEKAGYGKVQYVPVSDPFDAEKKLSEGKIDCIIYHVQKSGNASADFLVSESYYETETYAAAKKSTLFTSLSDLSGKTVGFLPYESEEFALLSRKMETEGLLAPVPYEAEGIKALSEAMESGEISAICASDSLFGSMYTSDIKIIDREIGVLPVSVAVQKGNPKGEKIVDTVNNLIAEGVIRDLLFHMGWED